MIYYLYRTTCTATGKYYIGVHSTNTLNDGYLGSGFLLSRSVSKHGRDCHSKEILEYFESKEEMYARESETVTEAVLQDSLCMNLKPGGSGGWASEDHKLKAIRSARATVAALREADPEWDAKLFTARSEGHRRSYKNGRVLSPACTVLQPEMVERAKSLEARAKRLSSLKAIGHSQGEKNSQFGTCWVSNNVETIKVPKDSLQDYLDQGYIRGRKQILV